MSHQSHLCCNIYYANHLYNNTCMNRRVKYPQVWYFCNWWSSMWLTSRVILSNWVGSIGYPLHIYHPTLGDLGVGKTSLVKKYCSSDSGPEYKVSVDVTHSCKCVNINGQKINLQLWDIPGHERFGGITRVHYKVRNRLFSEIGNMRNLNSKF